MEERRKTTPDTFWDFKPSYLYHNTKSRLRQRMLQAAFRISYLIFLVEYSIWWS